MPEEAHKESLMDKAKGMLHHHKKDETSEAKDSTQPQANKPGSELHKAEDYVKKSQAQDAEQQAEGKEYGGLM